MAHSADDKSDRQRFDRPLAAALAGTFVLRCASWAAGFLVGLYLGKLDRSGVDVPTMLVGIVAVSFYASELVGGPLFGWLSDRRGRRLFMILGPLLGGTAIQMLGLSRAIPILLLVRILEGLSTASAAPSTLSYLSARTAGSKVLRARVMAYFEVATVVGLASGSVVAGILWDRLGGWSFTAIAGLYLLSLLLFTQVDDETARARQPAHRFPALRLLRSDLLHFAPAWLAVNCVLGVWFAHAAFQLSGGPDPRQRLAGGFSGTEIGIVFAVFGILFSAGAVFWGFLMPRLGSRRTMALGVSGIFVAAASLYLINHAPDGRRVLYGALALLAVGIFLESGFTPAALAHLAGLAEAQAADRGAVMGLYTVLLGVGQLLGGFLGGVFAAGFEVDGLIFLSILLGIAAGVSLKTVAADTWHAHVIPIPAHSSEPEQATGRGTLQFD